jgi:hypothetical protein
MLISRKTFYGAGMLIAISTSSIAQPPPQDCVCKFVGEWTHSAGTTIITPDGIMTPRCNPLPYGAKCTAYQTWTCKGDTITFMNSDGPGPFTGTLTDANHMNGSTWTSTRISGGSCSSSSRKPPAPISVDQAPSKETSSGNCLKPVVSKELNYITNPGLCESNIHPWINHIHSTHNPGCDRYGVNFTYTDNGTRKSADTSQGFVVTCGGPATNIKEQ